ncbi:leucine--tRNA ligase [Candidatus Microgenomates bacterium]|nr:leucine--tRNA ligase [Candidatus Microgenomates bacterium]
MDKYDPSVIEPKWQAEWDKNPPYKAIDFDSKPKYYALVEFPYPSGDGIHLGHAFTNTVLDIHARKKRLSGFNVLYPMGWDAFGLPTENYAIKTGIQPAVATKKNTDHFRAQDKKMALAYDWDREINTTDPGYYKWTQWIFLKFFEHGLAYKAETPVGWCPSCKIILANEEIVDGSCERCGTPAERRMQKQWLLKITAYADRLADELDLVDYPNSAKQAQRNWIGRKEGINFKHKIKDLDIEFEVFDSKPQTFMAQTFVVIAPEHPMVKKLVEGTQYEKPVMEFVEKIKRKKMAKDFNIDKEKEGIFTGRYSQNYMNTGRDLPIWVASFVLAEYGTGIVGSSAHDERDFAFAKAHNIPQNPVLFPKDKNMAEKVRNQEIFYNQPDGVLEAPAEFKGMTWEEAYEPIVNYILEKGFGKTKVNYHLHDWVFSRQHYWGEPIPIIECPKCGLVPVPESELPLKLPEVEKYQPTETGESPLANITEWVNTKCPKCGGPAKRETDTMPNWAGSSWYYLRYCDPNNPSVFADKKKLEYWGPVDLYLGGAEHTTLHLLYSRFWHKFLNDLNLVPGKEPYLARRQHGMILAENGVKMSKSKGNVVNPDDIIAKYGADAVRVYLAFMGPYESTMPWSSAGIGGSRRFVSRIWDTFHTPGKVGEKTDPVLTTKLAKTIVKIGNDVDSLKHNTAVSTLMIFLNAWESGGVLGKEDMGRLLIVLAPFAPHLAEELWQRLGNDQSVHAQSWPHVEQVNLEEEEIIIVVSINGKVRANLHFSSKDAQSLTEAEIVAIAQKDQKVIQHLDCREIKKTVYVKGKILNFVV